MPLQGQEFPNNNNNGMLNALSPALLQAIIQQRTQAAQQEEMVRVRVVGRGNKEKSLQNSSLPIQTLLNAAQSVAQSVESETQATAQHSCTICGMQCMNQFALQVDALDLIWKLFLLFQVHVLTTHGQAGRNVIHQPTVTEGNSMEAFAAAVQNQTQSGSSPTLPDQSQMPPTSLFTGLFAFFKSVFYSPLLESES